MVREKGRIKGNKDIMIILREDWIALNVVDI